MPKTQFNEGNVNDAVEGVRSADQPIETIPAKRYKKKPLEIKNDDLGRTHLFGSSSNGDFDSYGCE